MVHNRVTSWGNHMKAMSGASLTIGCPTWSVNVPWGDRNYRNARQIINGMNEADAIAVYAEEFEACLLKSIG